MTNFNALQNNLETLSLTKMKEILPQCFIFLRKDCQCAGQIPVCSRLKIWYNRAVREDLLKYLESYISEDAV